MPDMSMSSPSTDTRSPRDIPLAGKIALVCGSTQGIGRAAAIALAARGASVVLAGRNADGLANVLGDLPASDGATHGTLLADFADWRPVQESCDRLVSERGPIHILVHNTGGPAAGPLTDARPEDLATAFAQHVLTAQALVQSVAPGMRDAKYGRVIAITSTSVVTPIAGIGVSNVIRAAMGNWVRTLATELGPLGITVNAVLPGYTRTGRLESILNGRASRGGVPVEEVEENIRRSIPVRRLADPAEVAEVIAFLASPAASYVNGVNMPVDGGRLAGQ